MRPFTLTLLLCCLPIAAQAPAASQPGPFKALAFLEGTWQATAQGAATASGRYTFQTELGDHILARHSTSDPNCKGPATFDCAHGDLLYVFQEAPGQPLKAIFFDNEGHVIHYSVATPTPSTAIFLSEPGPGPQFRLVYELKGASMSGKFQMLAPGQTGWRSYLEWSGSKD